MTQESMSRICSQRAPLLYRRAASGRLMAMFIPIRTPIASALASVIAPNPWHMTIYPWRPMMTMHSDNPGLLGTRWRDEQTWFPLPVAYWLMSEPEKLFTHLWHKSEWQKFCTAFTCQILWDYRRRSSPSAVQNQELLFGGDGPITEIFKKKRDKKLDSVMNTKIMEYHVRPWNYGPCRPFGVGRGALCLKKEKELCFSTVKFSGSFYKVSFFNLSVFINFSVIPSPKYWNF